jgi:hypothetical protein
MKFTDTLWNQIQPIYDKILEHPFNQEFIQGSLSREVFQFYLKQDSLYLLDFSRALALIGAKSTSPDRVVQFLEFARGILAVVLGDMFGTGKGSGMALQYTLFSLLGSAIGLGGYLFPVLRDVEKIVPDYEFSSE